MTTNRTSSFFLLPSSFAKARRAFTLVELIVVIGIIGVLAGILIASFSGGTESARAAKCLSNMRNLAQGALGYMVKSYGYPAAGSHAVISTAVSGNGDILYEEQKGWISWLSMNNEYKNPRNSVVSLPNISACCADETKATFAITNGALWKSVGQSRETYICPEHAILASAKGARLRFSYAMNAYFHYDVEPNEAIYEHDSRVSMNENNNFHADRTLLFAELPFGTAASSYDTANTRTADGNAYDTSDNNAALDCVLQYKATYNGENYNTDWGGTPEAIAFNHKSGKRKWCAHVAFADGHVEKLSLPAKNGNLNAEQLTALLCGGVAVTFDGSGYSMPNDADKGRNQ